MFCVYGKSKVLVKKTIGKKLLSKVSEASEAIAKLDNPTQDEKQSVIDEFIEQEFIDCKVKKCTHEFSTPEIAKEALDIMKYDVSNFSDLIIMKKVNKLNANGEMVLHKISRKPAMLWVPLYEE